MQVLTTKAPPPHDHHLPHQPVWKTAADTILRSSTSLDDASERSVRVVQAETTGGERVVGLNIPQVSVAPLETALEEWQAAVELRDAFGDDAGGGGGGKL